MVEDASNNTVDGSVDICSLIVHTFDDLRDNPFKDLRGNLSSWLVKDLGLLELMSYKTIGTYVGEMILGKHRVGRIRAFIIVKDDQLLILTALNDLGRTGIQLILDLANNRQNEWSDQREDKHVDLSLELFDKFGKHWDLLNSFRNRKHNLVVPCHDGLDLLCNLLHLNSKLFWISWRYAGLVHLGICCVHLELFGLSSFILVAKDAFGNLVEKILEQACISTSLLLNSALEFLDFALSGLVGDLCTQLGVSDCTSGKFYDEDTCLREVGNHVPPITECKKSTPPNVPVTIG